MRENLIQDINNYITHLESKGFNVSIHGKTISGLFEHNIHRNPFCEYVKTNADAQKRCVKCQQKVVSHFDKNHFFGMCYAGCEEYVFFSSKNTFISISGYAIDTNKAKERISFISNEFSFNKTELFNIYERGLKHKKENEEELKVIIKPLCHMLSLLEITLSEIKEIESKSKTFDSILSFVQKNVMQDISIRDISEGCSLSQSTVSHLFKEYMGISLKRYISEQKINQAQNLLSTSDLSIGSIANLCGFSNTNYFSTAFKKQTGKSPSEFRNK